MTSITYRLSRHLRTLERGADIEAVNEGSFATLSPLTEKARTWLRHAASGEATWHGEALVVEMRYIPDIVEAAIADGLFFLREDSIN